MIPEKPKMIIKIWKMPTPAAKEQKVEMKKNVFFWKKLRCSCSQSNFAFLTIYFQMNKQSSEKLLWNWKLEKRSFRFVDFLTSKNYRIYFFVPNFAWIYKKILFFNETNPCKHDYSEIIRDIEKKFFVSFGSLVKDFWNYRFSEAKLGNFR